MRSDRLTLLAAAVAALGAACSTPESFIVLSMESATPIADVVHLRVTVSKGATVRQTLTYDTHGEIIDQTKKTLSVGFSGDESGNIDFRIDALDDAGCSVAHGTTAQEIKRGGVAFAPLVTMVPGRDCSVVGDAGVPGRPEGGVLPGCDPVNPQSTAAGVTTCAGTQTCQVDCVPPMDEAPRNECIAGGSGAPGAICNSNADCMPGTQCFNYAVTGCAVKVCLRFCGGTADCAAFGAGGGGPGSVCEGPVMCPGFLTAYRTCTFNCDPRASAAATRGGCPVGLACVMPAAMDAVDCACAGSTRIKREGESCAAASDCLPGLICNEMAGAKTCRPICRCNAGASGTCTTAASDCPTAGTTCRALTNNTIYGVCL